ncbi:hypothetical protein JM658_12035 [Joostella atrarenae]|uniref:Uncharacterized protein n=1 Tax=Joostella atrarenae TaxID=679257 RepID=A0ABS9J543_9FLAO|nr:hypothetical protein [Joostella atrarenae]MCF8715555.1 hypothetical protein [Joostella atrarenae]
MSKLYSYKDLQFPVADETDVYFSVELISDGNIIYTAINVPGDNDQQIEDAGTVFIGKGKDLRSETTFCFSRIVNLVPKEEDIRIQYKCNDQILTEHFNPKSEEKRPYVVLCIKFPFL